MIHPTTAAETDEAMTTTLLGGGGGGGGEGGGGGGGEGRGRLDEGDGEGEEEGEGGQFSGETLSSGSTG